MSAEPELPPVVIDEAYLREWLELGFTALAGYLHRWAAFDAFLRERGAGEGEHHPGGQELDADTERG